VTEVLVINTGSSSLKYQLVNAHTEDWSAKGIVERIGEPGSRLVHERREGEKVEVVAALPDHGSALALILETCAVAGPDLSALVAVGHRVVHGGPDYREPVLIDAEVEDTIEGLIPLAPLHNPAALMGIRELRRLMPHVPHVAVFDTAFHATMPAEAYTYAIPRAVARDFRLRRYGFHGTSYRYVTRKSAEYLGVPIDQADLIVCHLGNGASMAAIRGGRSVDTSMGLTPLQGLVMGTRSGDIDPAVVFQLVNVAGMSLDDVDTMLNKSSGLKGLADHQDMREVRRRANEDDAASRLALDVYAYRIRGYIGAYYSVVPGVQALVFTAGIGEHDPALRSDVCAPLSHLGIAIDEERNWATGGGIRAIDDGSGPVRVLVVPTNEEAEIARQSALAVSAAI
jgi:acetate kinase